MNSIDEKVLKELVGDKNSLVKLFKIEYEKMKSQHLNTYTIEELKQMLEKFNVIFDNLNNNNYEIFKLIIANPDNDILKKYYEISLANISRIQNVCIIPIGYKINQIYSNINLKKANISIILGIISIIIGTSISVYSCISSNNSENNINDAIQKNNELIQKSYISLSQKDSVIEEEINKNSRMIWKIINK